MTTATTCYIDQQPANTTCTTCARPICAEHTLKGDPFISAGTLLRTAVSSPKTLVGPPLDQVDYCPDCREELASKRTTEQTKVLGAFLVLLIIVGALIYFFALA